MSKKDSYVATPLGILTTLMPFSDAVKVIDALSQHMLEHYGPVPGIVIDEQGFRFAQLERDK